MLLARDPKNRVTVVARHMPGDYDIEYTSPWAGANVLPCVPPAQEGDEEKPEEKKPKKKSKHKKRKNKATVKKCNPSNTKPE